jgi:hypothetical protein
VEAHSDEQTPLPPHLPTMKAREEGLVIRRAI